MNFLVKLSVLSFILGNGVNPMELSRVSQILNLGHVENQKVIPTINPPVKLKSPSDLFSSPKISKGIQTGTGMFSSDNNIGKIDDKSVVLHIGDSHTVGIYGKEMDNLLRKTGAKVTTVGSAGSSPSWWLNNKETKSGFYMKDQDGNVDSPANWKAPHVTPKLTDLIEKYHPNVIIFSLGANLVHENAEVIENQVKMVAKIAKKNNTKIIWVGPPNGRSDKKPKEVQDFLYEHIQKVANEYGAEFIDSRPYTSYPDNLKGDGVHFGGEEGGKIARNWANSVFNQIQGE